MKIFKWLMLGVMPMSVMCCGTKSVLVKESEAIAVNHVEAAGHRLMVMKPSKKCKLRFVSHKQSNFKGAPSIDDASIVLNVAAAFTLDTETMNVCGDHVVAGESISGYDDVTATGHMVIAGDKVRIASNGRLEQSLREAVVCKGYLFQQCLIVEDGKGMVERIPQAIRDRKAHIIYRAACVMNDGSFAIVQGDEQMYCNEFIDALVALGAQQALYLDMGTWAWGWVREKGKTTELAEHFFNTRYQSNWLQIVVSNQ
ncbi:MAG: hypothetical protein J6X22_08040 [Muribaculaceae bacterium]|nr:hypothetical protein [Muribaculaceae bacterium]